jgi:hypothetical protein
LNSHFNFLIRQSTFTHKKTNSIFLFSLSNSYIQNIYKFIYWRLTSDSFNSLAHTHTQNEYLLLLPVINFKTIVISLKSHFQNLKKCSFLNNNNPFVGVCVWVSWTNILKWKRRSNDFH